MNPLNALRREVLDCMESQTDWLDGLTVGLPPSSDAPTWRKQVEVMLSDLSIDAVDVHVVEVEGPPWIQTCATKPGWS